MKNKHDYHSVVIRKLNVNHTWENILWPGGIELRSMISDANLSAKGGETSDITDFCVALAKEFAPLDPMFVHLALAGSAMAQSKDGFEKSKRKLPHGELLKQVDLCKTFLCNFDAVESAAMTPKFHRYMHMVHEAGYAGNPKCTSTWFDEHENGIIAKVAAAVHASKFCESVHYRLMVKELFDL
jgi:hypothetical protein